jgi:hypothetical protein
VREHAWHDIQAGLRVTASIGLASARAPLDADALLTRADALLYEAKAGGRDRVVVAALKARPGVACAGPGHCAFVHAGQRRRGPPRQRRPRRP